MGSIATTEGCATISDSVGNLLFYSDGISVFDRRHKLMPNGDQLGGDPSSTQSGVIIKHPVNPRQYYLFSISANRGGGLHYSIVDMTLENGYGDVVETKKNIQLVSETSEKLAAVWHQNQKDVWLVTRERTNAVYHVYLISKKGIEFHSTQKAVGTPLSIRGYLKFSPLGTMMVSANGANVELYDFDNATGKIGHRESFPHRAYGVEFSLDEQFLYTATRRRGDLYQHYLKTGKSVLLASNVPLGALQNGPDGRMYIAQLNTAYLGVVHYPNRAGEDCEYEESYISVGATCTEGLPNFLTLPMFSGNVVVKDTCYQDVTSFTPVIENPKVKYSWKFNDAKAEIDTSSEDIPKHRFSAPGTYQVKLHLRLGGYEDSMTRNVTIKPLPEVLDTHLVRICPGDTFHMDAGNAGSSFTWAHGETTQEVPLSDPGVYTVLIDKDGCLLNDTVEIQVKDTVEVSLGRDTTLCDGLTIDLKTDQENDSLVWSTNDTTNQITVDKAGEYWVYVEKESCSTADTISVQYFPEPVYSTFDSLYCELDSIPLQLRAGKGSAYNWLPSHEVASSIWVEKADTYSVSFLDTNGCHDSASFHLESFCTHTIFFPNTFTPDGNDINDFYSPKSTEVNFIEMKVFDRWGTLVFNGPVTNTSGWDGTFRGRPCPIGVYVCLFQYEYDREKGKRKISHQKSITLVR